MARHRWLGTLLLLPLLQCQENSVVAPDIPDEIRANAIRLRVDLVAGSVAYVRTPRNRDISYSLVGSDGVTLQTSNISQSALSKNKNLIRFDIAITNSLTNVTLVKPTVPAPPAGTTGVLLFPFQATAVAGSGGVSASSDWNGAPFSFFNDVSCTGSASSDCYRWEQFAAPLAPGATSAAQTVGFEVDKNVTSFDVVMLLAADLQNVPPAPAAIALSQTTANFQSSSGSMSPSAVSVLVSNSGGGTISGLTASVQYQAGQSSGWLATDLSSTTAPSVLTLSASAGALTDGTYNASVAVTASGVANSPQTVSVTLVVTGSPVSNAIYVSESDPAAADNASCGLGPTFAGGVPCRSITQGLARAVATGRPEVRVADGRYTEAVFLVNGKNLLGGYHPDTWQRHLTTTNTIVDGVSSSGNHDRTVVAVGITSPTLFEGFVVRGPMNSKPGGNSYALYVLNSNASLTISRNFIYGGAGGPGSQGVAGAAGPAGANGAGRDSNPSGYDAKIATGPGVCDASNNRSYANGASGSAGGDDISGGNGGGNVCPPSSTFQRQSAQNGVAGSAAAGVGGGLAGFGGTGGLDFKLDSNGTLCLVAPSGSNVGENGGPGGNGQHGAAGAGAGMADGSVIGSHWTGVSGGMGGSGSNGGGGGGGGAGGGAYSVSTPENKDRLGGVGGGGGAGGAGGGGGGGGTAGGGAFGIFISGTAPGVTENTIVRGTGGVGGGGGAGATGTSGGSGGAGGLGSVFCTGDGGRGGDGGTGGIGAGGGGGSGGVSFGIYTSGAGTPNYCTSANNTISGGAAGAGGQGGQSQANPGGAGAAGATAACSFH